MTPEQAAHDTVPTVFGVPGRYMTDAATFARGAELGFEGLDFYVAGRGSALGDVPADVVSAAFVFFSPDVVRPAWERSAPVLPRGETALEWAACGHRWADAHLGDGADYERFAALLAPVVERASVAVAPVFAGFRTLPEPADPRALVQHRLYALRELRGALHGAALLTVGLTPHQALSVRTPGMAAVFGWGDADPDPEPLRDRWQLAEARTDRMFGRALAVLDEPERVELVALAADVAAAVR